MERPPLSFIKGIQMLKNIFFVLGFFLFFACGNQAWADCAKLAVSGMTATPLKAGVNVTGWLGNWKGSSLLGSNDASEIKNLGFTFVRLAVAPKHLEILAEDEQDKILSQLRCDIIGLLNENLSVVLDLHPVGKFHKNLARDDADTQFSRLMGIWKNLSVVINGLPPERIYLNILNEPIEKLPNWWALQGRLVAALRNIFPFNTFIVNAYYSSYKRLFKEQPYADKNLLYDFHFYVPEFFTHHGAKWDSRVDARERQVLANYPSSLSSTQGAKYPRLKDYLSESWKKEKLEEKLRPNIEWAKKYNVRLVCLEFGIYGPYVIQEGRRRWLSDMQHLFKQAGIPWALWNYNGDGFALVDSTGKVDRGMLDALGLGL